MYIDEFFTDDFYKTLRIQDPSQFSFGQIFKTHAYYPHEQLEIWRPVFDSGGPAQSIADRFVIRAAGQDAFRKDFPLGVPALRANEEFLVVRAKIRPVVLIRPELPPLDIPKEGYKGQMQRRRCLVAQVYGIRYTATQELKFPPLFIERIRKMLYPHLMFLPKLDGVFEVESILRLDELQSVFTPHLKPSGYALGDGVMKVLQDQIRTYFTGDSDNEYTYLKQELQN